MYHTSKMKKLQAVPEELVQGLTAFEDDDDGKRVPRSKRTSSSASLGDCLRHSAALLRRGSLVLVVKSVVPVESKENHRVPLLPLQPGDTVEVLLVADDKQLMPGEISCNELSPKAAIYGRLNSGGSAALEGWVPCCAVLGFAEQPGTLQLDRFMEECWAAVVRAECQRRMSGRVETTTSTTTGEGCDPPHPHTPIESAFPMVEWLQTLQQAEGQLKAHVALCLLTALVGPGSTADHSSVMASVAEGLTLTESVQESLRELGVLLLSNSHATCCPPSLVWNDWQQDPSEECAVAAVEELLAAGAVWPADENWSPPMPSSIVAALRWGSALQQGAATLGASLLPSSDGGSTSSPPPASSPGNRKHRLSDASSTSSVSGKSITGRSDVLLLLPPPRLLS